MQLRSERRKRRRTVGFVEHVESFGEIVEQAIVFLFEQSELLLQRDAIGVVQGGTNNRVHAC